MDHIVTDLPPEEAATLTEATNPLMTPERVAADEGPARFKERQAITTYIRKRSASVANLARHGRLTEADAHRLKRWLGALADDIDQQLHDEE